MKLPFFFKKKKSIPISKIFPKIKSSIKINSVATLNKSNKYDLTFFDNIKYKDFALNTKASFCITNEKLKKISDRLFIKPFPTLFLSSMD